LISTFSARDYAENRVVFHHDQFQKIYKIVKKYAENGEIPDADWSFIEDIEVQDFPFAELDFRIWSKKFRY